MVYVHLANGFEECEALAPLDIIRRAGLEITTVSITGDKTVYSAHGVGVVADTLLEEVDLSGADMLVLPGGLPGSTHLDECEPLRQAILKHHAEGKPLAAICAAPTLLARHRLIGVGNYAVCYPGMEDLLTAAGVTPSMEDAVVLDETLITGKAPGTVFDFALSLLEVLTDADTAARIQDDLHYGV